MTGKISKQAREFLESGLPVAAHVPISRENIEALRTQTIAAYQPAIDYAMAHYVGSTRSVTYGGVDCLEISPPELRAEHQDVVLFYLFGGAFIQGSPEEDLPISGFLARQLGIPVISLRYRRAPEHPYPAALDDAFAAYKGILEQHPGKRLLIAGESAGGNLTLLTLNRARTAGLPMPVACAVLSPWADLTNAGDSLAFNDGRDPTLVRAYVDNATELFTGGADPGNPRVSSLYAEYDATFPPTLITSGTRDLLLSQCVNITRALREAGVDVELRIWEEMWHVFEFYPQLPEAKASLREIGDFLESRL